MLIQNLSDINKSISKTVNVAFMVIFALSILLLFFVHQQLNSRREAVNYNDIQYTLGLYKYNLSEKLGIIANSSLFLDYLRSGEVTRDRMHLRFLSKLFSLKNHSVIGMNITDSSNNVIFSYGDKKGERVKLRLCYLNNTLNSKFGQCNYSWELFFSGKNLIEDLKKFNKNIEYCKTCEPFNFVEDKKIGSFDVVKSNNILLHIKIKHNETESYYIYFYLFLIIVTLLPFAIWSKYKLRWIFKKFISTPVVVITESIKKDTEISHKENFIEELSYLYNQVLNWKKRTAELQSKENEVKLVKMATQVAHDIRSPLAALDIVIKDITQVPVEQRELILHATQRIHDIANNLLTQHKDVSNLAEKTNKNTPELIADMVLSVASEKRAQHKASHILLSTEISEAAYSAFVSVVASDFKRVLSNLLNNAFEAFQNNAEGKINLCLDVEDNRVKLTIQDNGCGIPPDILPKILTGGVSFDKPHGHGLGLSSAIKMIEDNWTGQFLIDSGVNVGTMINIYLPKSYAPAWFASELTISKNEIIVILDDDQSIHDLWHQRLESIDYSLSFFDFYNMVEFLEWYSKHPKQAKLFLIDYELLGSDSTGLEIIEQLNIATSSYLVTSRYQESAMQQHCQKIGLKLIPKSFVIHIPIYFKSADIADLIFIDDDEELTEAWKMLGDKVGKKVITYNRIEEFRAEMDNYTKNIPIYIDSNLNSELSGELFAKELYDKGFLNLYLATGYDASFFGEMPWIKEIVEKTPPF